MGVFLSFEFMTLCGKGGHSRPLAATLEERPLAATCGHSSGCEWLQVAAFSEIQIPRPRVEGGHLRPLDRAATCGHLRPLEWLQVAAFLKFKYRAECNPNEIPNIQTRKSNAWACFIFETLCLPRHSALRFLL